MTDNFFGIKADADPFALPDDGTQATGFSLLDEKSCGCPGACDCDEHNSDGLPFGHTHDDGHDHSHGMALLAEGGLNTGGFHLDTLSNFIVSDDSTLAPPRDVITRSATDFNIELNYTGDVEYLDEFQNAIAVWESIITGDLSDRVLDGEVIDDLRIDATVEFIDGAGNILGSAGPRNLRGENLLPFTGVMRFDEDDIANIDANGTLQDVIIHEIGHVLGIGTLWGSNWIGLVDADFRYTGANGLAEYQALTAADNDYAPVEEDFGPGTQGGHWDETLFNAELMTGFTEGGGTALPLSRVTIGALEDLGYAVDYTPADPFSLPGGAPADDFTADLTTTGTVGTDGTAQAGTVGTGGDTDWFSVMFTAGREYVIDVLSGTLSDTYIHGVYDANGDLIANTTTNTGGTGNNAQLTYTATTTGEHFISAGAYAARTGTYTLTVEDGAGPVLVLDASALEVGSASTIADALGLASDGFEIQVGDGYEEVLEAATVTQQDLTVQIASGLSTPTLTLDDDVTGITLLGAGDADVIGNAIANVIDGNAGNNAMSGEASNDRLIGRGGNDTLEGGIGDDTVNGGQGNDVIEGGADNDNLIGAGNDDSIDGNQGADSIFGGAGFDTVNGGTEADSILGQSNDDVLMGDGGEDIIRGGSGGDLIEGGDDDDMLYGNGNNDTIDGGSGADFLQGAAGADDLIGGSGEDSLFGGNGGDDLDGGAGNDLLIGGNADGAQDSYVFMVGYDEDRINSFEIGVDQIMLDETLWDTTNPGLIAQQVVNSFGSMNGNNTVLTLDFGGGDVLEVQNAGGIDQSTFGSDIVFI